MGAKGPFYSILLIAEHNGRYNAAIADIWSRLTVSRVTGGRQRIFGRSWGESGRLRKSGAIEDPQGGARLSDQCWNLVPPCSQHKDWPLMNA